LTAGALGLGEITLRSGLNQPFVAEIPVTADSADELTQLNVQLAPAATFERFGLDRPSFLESFTFNVQKEGSRAVIRVTSAQPMSEPFISLILDVGWSQGRLLREYTVLLDPPAFAQPEGGKGQAAAPPAPALPAAAGPAAAPQVIRRPTAPDGGSAPGNAATGSLTASPGGDTYGPVRSNETLWAISERLRANRNVSVNQMIVALYRANPEAFAGNINRLRRGAILRVPGGSDLAGVSRRDAAAEVRRQDEEWRGSSSAAPASTTAAPARLQLVPPTESASGIAPAASQSAAPTADRPALERELAEQRRLLSLKDSQLTALQDRIRQLEGQAPAPAQVPPTIAAPEAPAGPAASVVTTDERPPIEQRKTSRPTKTSRPAERPRNGGFLNSVGAVVFSVSFLGSAAVVLLAGLFFVFARRRMATANEASGRIDNAFRGDRPAGAASSQPGASRDGYSVEEVAGGDRAGASVSPARASVRDVDAETPLERTISTDGAVELDQADVVAEADFHMAYGLYDQAAELLTRALRDSPDRRDLRLKLLEVYFIWENKASFLKEALAFQRLLKGAADPAWSKVVIMGKQICPNEPLFAGAVSTTSDAGLDLALADDDATKSAVDISFDEGDAGSVDLDFSSMGEGSGDNASMMETDVASRSDRDSGARTAEIPTVEARYAGDFSATMETPTIESRELGVTTMETPTLESAVPGVRPGAADSRRSGGADQTEEINLEDLGLDLTGLDEAAGELGTGVHGSLDGDGDPDLYDLGTAEDEASDLLQGLEGDSTAEMRGMALDEGTLDLPAFGNAMEKSAASRDRLQDEASETAEHRAVEDTAEQPRASATSLSDASVELSQVDFDIGDDKVLDLEPTSVMTGRRRGPDGPTMTEVGTKLDLARAYVDMGDPDGARSILNEVLEEGDSAQRQEARRLLDDLTD
jgi:pilus assembly protein FimV